MLSVAVPRAARHCAASLEGGASKVLVRRVRLGALATDVLPRLRRLMAEEASAHPAAPAALDPRQEP